MVWDVRVDVDVDVDGRKREMRKQVGLWGCGERVGEVKRGEMDGICIVVNMT